MELKIITYEEARMHFFKDQLSKAERKLRWEAKHSDDWNRILERADEVSFFSWAVEIAEMGAEPVVRCKDCKHEETCCRSVNRNNGEGFCSDGERKDDD